MEKNISPFEWYSYDNSASRTYGYTLIYPIIVRTLKYINSPVIIGIVYSKESRFPSLKRIYLKDDEKLVEFEPPRVTYNIKYLMIEGIFDNTSESSLEEIRTSMG